MIAFKEDRNAIYYLWNQDIDRYSDSSFWNTGLTAKFLQLPIVWHCNILESDNFYISILLPSNFMFLENTKGQTTQCKTVFKFMQI